MQEFEVQRERVVPLAVKRALRQLGRNISVARRKRRLTGAMMCERAGISKQTYQRVEKGDLKVAMGTYAICLFILGSSDALGEILDLGRDQTALLLDQERIPKKVRPRRTQAEIW